MSPFATALKSLLDDTDYFTRKEWAKFLGVKVDDIKNWLDDKVIPRASHVGLVYITLESRRSKMRVPLEAFEKMMHQPAKEVSPIGNQMLPTVHEYMTRLIFCDISNKLATIWEPEERGKFLEKYYKEEAK